MTWGELKEKGDKKLKDNDVLWNVDFDGEIPASKLKIKKDTNSGKFTIYDCN